eukprot:COSAG05_NODE_12602_length_462_cov_0.542700_1_plen_103_part_10
MLSPLLVMVLLSRWSANKGARAIPTGACLPLVPRAAQPVPPPTPAWSPCRSPHRGSRESNAARRNVEHSNIQPVAYAGSGTPAPETACCAAGGADAVDVGNDR